MLHYLIVFIRFIDFLLGCTHVRSERPRSIFGAKRPMDARTTNHSVRSLFHIYLRVIIGSTFKKNLSPRKQYVCYNNTKHHEISPSALLQYTYIRNFFVSFFMFIYIYLVCIIYIYKGVAFLSSLCYQR